MRLVVEPGAGQLGIDACMAVFEGVRISNRSNPLERRKKEALEPLRAVDAATDPVLSGYRALHARLGVGGVVPPAQRLLEQVQASGRLPNINTVVDAYNLVSALTRLSVGAHDLAQVRGDVRLGLIRGDERYWPLGAPGPEPIAAGEYAALDAEKVLCRLDVRQCQETRITKDTQAFAVYVQGSPATPRALLEEGLRRIGELVVEIGGGRYTPVAVVRGGAP
ncbi:MAG: phenylalanine--tRNA ligase beta subunit-related protein [Anaeromyxobacter sp.]